MILYSAATAGTALTPSYKGSKLANVKFCFRVVGSSWFCVYTTVMRGIFEYIIKEKCSKVSLDSNISGCVIQKLSQMSPDY